MEYRDINNNSIKQGFYVETFYKDNDEFRNRIVYIAKSPSTKDLFSVINKANIVRLNPNYSRWLKPFKQEKQELKRLLLLRDADPRCGEGTDLMMDNNCVNDSGLPPVPRLVKLS